MVVEERWEEEVVKKEEVVEEVEEVEKVEEVVEEVVEVAHAHLTHLEIQQKRPQQSCRTTETCEGS